MVSGEEYILFRKTEIRFFSSSLLLCNNFFATFLSSMCEWMWMKGEKKESQTEKYVIFHNTYSHWNFTYKFVFINFLSWLNVCFECLTVCPYRSSFATAPPPPLPPFPFPLSFCVCIWMYSHGSSSVADMFTREHTHIQTHAKIRRFEAFVQRQRHIRAMKKSKKKKYEGTHVYIDTNEQWRKKYDCKRGSNMCVRVCVRVQSCVCVNVCTSLYTWVIINSILARASHPCVWVCMCVRVGRGVYEK